MFINEFLNHYKFMDKSENTITNYRSDLNQFYELMFLDDEKLKELKVEDAMIYIDILKNKGMGNRSINRKLSTVSAFCSYLYTKEYIGDNVFKKIGKLSVDSNEPKYLEKEEAKIFLNLAKEKVEKSSPIKRWLKLRDLLIVEIFLSVGIRAFEMEALTIRDIELEGKHRGRITVRKGKGNKKRCAYLNSEVVETYEKWLYERKIKNIQCEELFVSLNGTKLCKRQIQNIISNLADELGFDITAHGLRHTYATLCLENNAELKSLSKSLGHSSTAITESVYIHATDKDLKDCRDSNPLF